MRTNRTVPAAPPTKLLSMKEVRALTGVSVDTIYRWGREGKFPRHIAIGERCSRWREDEIAAWIAGRSSERPRCASGGRRPTGVVPSPQRGAGGAR
jgi:prophage regulatory protein